MRWTFYGTPSGLPPRSSNPAKVGNLAIDGGNPRLATDEGAFVDQGIISYIAEVRRSLRSAHRFRRIPLLHWSRLSNPCEHCARSPVFFYHWLRRFDAHDRYFH